MLGEKLTYLYIQSFRLQTKQNNSMISKRRAFHGNNLNNQTFSIYQTGLIVNIAVRVPHHVTSAQKFRS